MIIDNRWNLDDHAIVLEHLDLVLLRLRHPDSWTTHAYARDHIGRSCDYHSRNARCWSLDGAVHSTAPSTYHDGLTTSVLTSILRTQKPHYERYSMADYNDAESHDAIINLLQLARKRILDNISKINAIPEIPSHPNLPATDSL